MDMLAAAIAVVLDFFLLKTFLQSYLKQRKFSDSQMALLIAYSIWISRMLLFSYLLLLQDMKMLIWVSAIIVFIGPHFLMMKTDNEAYFSSLKKINIKSFTLITLVLYLLGSLGENTWDGSAYHLPIELLVTKYYSIFGWPDFIYAQWQQSTVQLGAAFFDVLFRTHFAGSMISSVSFLFLIYFFSGFTRSKTWLSAIILLSIPAVFHQIGTRYIDITIGIGIFAFFVLLHQFYDSRENSLSLRDSDKYVLLCLFPVSALIIGAKSSTFLPVAIIWTFFTLKHFHSKENRNWKQLVRSIRLTSIIGTGSIFGAMPIFIRNIIEFSNPFYPYQVPGFENGLFGHSKVSNYLTGFYSGQVNLADVPMTVAVFFQYFLSPFQPFLVLLNNLDLSSSNFVSNVASHEVIYRTFVYDNRLGGFGLIFVILAVSYLISVKSKFARLTFLICFLGFSLLPTSIHPRYYLGFGLISIAVFVRALNSRKIFSKRNFLTLIVVFSIFSAAMNTFNWFARTNPSIFQTNTYDENSRALAQTINPKCLDSIHVGSGLWATTGLFGPSACSIPFFSLTVGGSLIDAYIGPRFLTSRSLNRIEAELLKRQTPVQIICTHPKNMPDPCNSIQSHLSMKGVKILRNFGSEAVEGPSWSTLEVISHG